MPGPDWIGVWPVNQELLLPLLPWSNMYLSVDVILCNNNGDVVQVRNVDIAKSDSRALPKPVSPTFRIDMFTSFALCFLWLAF